MLSFVIVLRTGGVYSKHLTVKSNLAFLNVKCIAKCDVYSYDLSYVYFEFPCFPCLTGSALITSEDFWKLDLSYSSQRGQCILLD